VERIIPYPAMEETGGVGGRMVGNPVVQFKADNFGVTTVTSLLKTINFCEVIQNA